MVNFEPCMVIKVDVRIVIFSQSDFHSLLGLYASFNCLILPPRMHLAENEVKGEKGR